MKRTVAPSSEPRKTRKAALLESDNKTEAKVQKKRSSDATESSGSPAKISKASHVIVAAATSPATQRIKAAEWAAEQYQLKPKKAKTPVKSPSKSSAVEDKPPVIRRPRKSISTMEAEVLEPVADGVTQPTRSMRPRRTVETKVAQAVVRVVQADNAVVAVAASPKRTSTGTIMKLMLGVHIIAGLALYLHHTNNLFPSIFHCPIEGYISMGVIALLHLFSR